MSTKTAAVIFNPRSGAHRNRDRVAEIHAYCSLLTQRGIDAAPRPTSAPGDATRLAAEAVGQGVDLVVASGGDGTLNEVAQGMARSRTPLAILPAGTANVLAHDLKIPVDPAANAAMTARFRLRPITLGQAGSRWFFLMAGIGLDAEMVKGTDSHLKAKLGEGAYWISALKHLVKHPKTFSVEIDGRTYESALTIVGNSRGYGGGFSLTPNADIFAAGFEVCIFPPHGFGFEYLPYAVSSFFGNPALTKNVVTLRTNVLTARSADETPVWVQVDGELHDRLPMRFEAVPEALTLVVPE